METPKIIQTVWNNRGSLLEVVRTAIITSWKNNEPLPEEISDMFSYRVYETATHVKIVIDFV